MIKLNDRGRSNLTMLAQDGFDITPNSLSGLFVLTKNGVSIEVTYHLFNSEVRSIKWYLNKKIEEKKQNGSI